jgi:hypothetical protein
MLAWSQTATPFMKKATPGTFPNQVSSIWRLPLHILSFSVALVLLLPEWIRWRMRKRRTIATTAPTYTA